MQVEVDYHVVERLLDTLLPRWRSKRKKFPYDKPDAVIPQNIIPKRIRKDKKTLALFYFYTCIYMRGGIESLQAFNALIELWDDYPELFKPEHAEGLLAYSVQITLARYIGWDAKAASINWTQNSRRLMQSWDGNPLNLIAGLHNYDEALRRIKNKLGTGERKRAGEDGHGFRGFQPKMVSMLLYFYDWEGWLAPRFLYPAPADFHNFRLGLSQGAIILPHKMASVRTQEDISKPWRDALMRYLVERSADPIEVADALWMFSLVMCGNSPLVRSDEVATNGSGMFSPEILSHELGARYYAHARFRPALERTCLRCPIMKTCTLAIPSKPYYRKGLLMLDERPQVEQYVDPIDPDKHPLSRKKGEGKVPRFI